MQTVLFHSTIFGPIHSRRLGVSLGINLTPDDGKICTFDCLYCEAGFNAQGPGTTGFPPRERVARLLESRLKNMKAAGEPLDVITFSGNGEPTDAKASVLSNSTRLENTDVIAALRMVDNNILKLDSAITSTMRTIDRPTQPSFTSERAIANIAQFHNQCIVQTMFLRGEYDGVKIDNTVPAEVDALIEAYKIIQPREVMIYSIDRKTPAENLEKVSKEELQAIAEKITSETGIQVQVA